MADVEQIEQARFISAGRVAPSPVWRMAAHHHAFHELICVVDGAMTVESGDFRLTAVAGDVLWYPPGVVHAERSDPRRHLESRFLVFTCPGLTAARPVRATDGRGRIREITTWLRSDTDAASPAARAERDALLRAALADFLRGSGREDESWVARTRAYIRAHIAESLTLDRLARLNGLSRFHFLRAYRAATGRTPMQDVRTLRVSRARELILGSDLPFKEIAPRVGLGNEYAMSRLFRRLLGLPPGHYRSRHCAGITRRP